MVICLQDTARVRICSKKTTTLTSTKRYVKSHIHEREDVANTDKSSMSGTHVGWAARHKKTLSCTVHSKELVLDPNVRLANHRPSHSFLKCVALDKFLA